MYDESELIPISALQHFVFCPRQCALIFIEGIWKDNSLTVQGTNLHRRVHTPGLESRLNVRKIFDMPLRSLTLGLIGMADVVMKDRNGSYIPLEYKHGRPKMKEMDTVQLCAQTLCLEEMTGKIIDKGFIYYFGTRKRIDVVFDRKLRDQTLKTIEKVRNLFQNHQTPLPVFSTKCKSCSLVDQCLPSTIEKSQKVQSYLLKMTENDPEGGSQ